jgi:hypothetical protein
MQVKMDYFCRNPLTNLETKLTAPQVAGSNGAMITMEIVSGLDPTTLQNVVMSAKASTMIASSSLELALTFCVHVARDNGFY